ncbi:MAG: hypothetical protein EA382_08955 [Spirochaetaceae bacterium]|nr:MAG: hypothetical protein EA382_08955 [Spirochaetaceae bacterium]
MGTIGERIAAYSAGLSSTRAVIDAISEVVYRYPAGRPGFSEEDSAEFLLMFYPRIMKLVARYDASAGRCFEVYLNTTLKYQLRTFAARHSTERIRLATAVQPGVADEIRERPPEGPYAADEAPERVCYPLGRRRLSTGLLGLNPPSHGLDDGLTPSQAQRVLVMALKAEEQLSMERCVALADWIGWDRNRMVTAWQQLRALYGPMRERRLKLQAARDGAWFRVRCIENRLRIATDEIERRRLGLERTRWQRRHERSRYLLSTIPAGPSHQQIAHVLGIPKGTVDSGVFKARREVGNQAYLARLARLFEES